VGRFVIGGKAARGGAKKGAKPKLRSRSESWPRAESITWVYCRGESNRKKREKLNRAGEKGSHIVPGSEFSADLWRGTP